MMRDKSRASGKGGGQMTVAEAGKKGGKKGGEAVKEKYGAAYYSQIGEKGGQIRGQQIRDAAEYFKLHPEERP